MIVVACALSVNQNILSSAVRLAGCMRHWIDIQCFCCCFFFNILHFSRIEFAANGFFPLVINGWLFVSSWLLFYINIELPASMQLLSEGDLKREKNAHTRADTQTMHDCVKSLKWTLSIHSIIETQFESTHSLGVSTMGSLCAIDNN